MDLKKHRNIVIDQLCNDLCVILLSIYNGWLLMGRKWYWNMRMMYTYII